MEKLNYEYQGGRKLNAVHAPAIAGVVFEAPQCFNNPLVALSIRIK